MNRFEWEIPKEAASDDIVATILASRGLDTKAQKVFLNPTYPGLLDHPAVYKSMDRAVARIALALKKKEKIAVYGDYDIDGLCATTLLYEVLTKAGAETLAYIPDRFEEGYGLNKGALDHLKAEGVGLVISVDCGGRSHAEAAYAKSIGLDLIITDHHEMDDTAPQDAVAVVNPKRADNKPCFTEVAGVTVAFQLVRALQQQEVIELADGQEKWLLDLVALATVCDVVPLVAANRELVHFGLMVLRKSPRAGIRALCKAAGVEQSNITEEDLGFRLGPRLNAAGRMEHARHALSLLMATDQAEAERQAAYLNDLNLQRQADTKMIYEMASAMARHDDRQILVLSHPDWSHGVVGIVASRIVERYHKPVILLQELPDGTAKGSARSVDGVSIIDAIGDSADLLTKHGGHQFAAGVTLPAERIEAFRDRINKYASSNVNIAPQKLVIDAQLQLQLLALDLLDLLERLRPFGRDNAEPVLASQATLEDVRWVGAERKHAQISLSQSGRNYVRGISFGAKSWLEADKQLGQSVQVAYRLRRNNYQGVDELQLEVLDIHPAL
jgi:single-stranded-DNA-specific exonuclease